jgi:hypothetical protein
MYEKHHNADYQQAVNEAAGNVKSQESKQPKNNQNSRNYSQHILNSLCLLARIGISLSRSARMPTSHWIRVVAARLSDLEFEICSI